MTNYKQIVNHIAYNQLSTDADIPDRNLAVGDGESLESVPILVFSDFHLPQPLPVIQSYEDLKIEDVSHNFEGLKLDFDSFPHSDFLAGIPSVGV